MDMRIFFIRKSHQIFNNLFAELRIPTAFLQLCAVPVLCILHIVHVRTVIKMAEYVQQAPVIQNMITFYSLRLDYQQLNWMLIFLNMSILFVVSFIVINYETIMIYVFYTD